MHLPLITLLFACTGGAPAPGPSAGPTAQPAAPTEPWNPDLAVAVPAPLELDGCPDADGDGFPSAEACPTTPAGQADCDDTDPAITPATERWVRPGPFLMGSTAPEAGRDESPVHVVELSGYCLDRTEVDTATWAAARGAPAPEHARRPAEGLSWDEARDLCASLGKALPTEAQWEKAARGGCEGGNDPVRCDPEDLRPYPWGNAPPDCEHANHALVGPTGPQPCQGGSMEVGSLPAGAGPYGHLDLAGNVWEYVADPYHPAVYASGAPRRDPAGPPDGAAHVLRGGAWNTFSTNMRAANRFQDLVMGSASGVRCARPTVTPTPDDVPALELVHLRGVITRHAATPITGRALYVAAFEGRDLGPDGTPIPGRSPLAEVRLEPKGELSQPFELPVPLGAHVLLSAALDAGSSAPGAPPSGSGGVGQLDHLIKADADQLDLTLRLDPLPGGGTPPPGP